MIPGTYLSTKDTADENRPPPRLGLSRTLQKTRQTRDVYVCMPMKAWRHCDPSRRIHSFSFSMVLMNHFDVFFVGVLVSIVVEAPLCSSLVYTRYMYHRSDMMPSIV